MDLQRAKLSMFSTARSWLIAALAIGFSWPAMAQEYRLQAGDIIEVSVAGLPQFSQRVPVQLDGSVAIPPIGTLEVEGETMANVRSWIQSGFASRLLTLYAPDGREMSRTVERDDVGASIVQYRPVWVSGDVTHPGEQIYQPGMTIRQAIATAGGLRPTTLDASISAIDIIGLRRDYITAWLGVASAAARVWRLKTELGETITFDPATIPPAPISDKTLSEILEIEVERRSIRQLDAERQHEFLEHATVLANEQIDSLTEQGVNEAADEAEDKKAYELAQDLLKKGKLTNSRVVETRRLALTSATRRLQTAAQLLRVQAQLAEYHRDLAQMSDRRRLGILEELQKAALELAEGRVLLESGAEKLQVAGESPSATLGAERKPTITLIRRSSDAEGSIKVGYEYELRPGDVIEVALRESSASADGSNGAEPASWRDAKKTN